MPVVIDDDSQRKKREEAEDLFNWITTTYLPWNYNIKFCPKYGLSVVGVLLDYGQKYDDFGDIDEYHYKTELSCKFCGYHCDRNIFDLPAIGSKAVSSFEFKYSDDL